MILSNISLDIPKMKHALLVAIDDNFMIKVPGQLHKSNALPLMRHSWRAVNPFSHFHSGG